MVAGSQKALFFALRYFGFHVDFASTQSEVLQHQHEQFHLVIVSDSFKEIGLNMLTAYFHTASEEYQPFLIYLGNSLVTEYVKLGFDAYLKNPFLIKNLFDVLPEHLKIFQL